MLDNIVSKTEVNELNFAKVPEGYAKFLSSGFDSIQESFDVTVTPENAEILFYLRDNAERNNSPISFPSKFNTDLQMMPIGASGFSYKLENDRYQIFIRNPAGRQRDWQVSARYLAYGLWMRGGHSVLKKEILKFIELLCYQPNSEDWQHITRADFCFDFYSEAFSKEMLPDILNNIVATSRAKIFINKKEEVNAVARNGKLETITIGSKKSLQVSVYDKTKEITESSGKTWFYDVWGKEYTNSVYRVEVRMSKDWLRDRNIIAMHVLNEHLPEILNDALRFRRIAIPNKDTNKSRWPVHPLWVMCFDTIKNPQTIVKIGRYVNQRKDYLENGFIKQAAGLARSFNALNGGDNDKKYIEFIKYITNEYFNDKKRKAKFATAKERYKFVINKKVS